MVIDQDVLNHWRSAGLADGRKGQAPVAPSGVLEKKFPGVVAAYRAGFVEGKKEYVLEGMKTGGRPTIFYD
jgi:hypothetical protein